MSETLSINPTMPIEAEQSTNLFNQIRNATVLRLSGAVLTGTVLLTGCSGGSETEQASSERSQGATQEAIENTCGDIDYAKNYADTNFGASTAVFPNLFKVEGDKQVLLDDENVSTTLKQTVSQDYRALAYVKAIFFDTRSAVNVADLSAANIAKNAQNLIASYENDSRDILKDVAEVCNGLAPAFVESTDSFRTSQNLATEAAFVRENGEIAETGFLPAATHGVLSGFKINPNYDDPALSDRREALQELASNAIITKDGKIVLKLVTGPLMFELDKNAEATPVDVKVDAGEQIVVSPKENQNEAPTGSRQDNTDQEGESPRGNNGGTSTNTGSNGGNTNTGSNGGDGPTGTNGGTQTGTNGCGTAGQPECGGGSGSDTGNEGTGDGDGGNTGGDTGGGDGGETGGGEEPAPAPTQEPAPKPQPTQEPAPKPQPTQEPAPKPQPTQEPTKEPEPTQPPKGEEPAPDCNPEYTPEGCN